MRSVSLRRLAPVAIACVASLSAVLPAMASADVSSSYAPDPAARNFADSAGGWTNSSSFDGSCSPSQLCPTVTNSFQPTGGADGNGFIRTGFSGVAGAAGVAGTATGIWESPQFSYTGAGGAPPTSVRFTMNRQANVDQVLAVAGNSADYSVDLLDVSAPSGSLSLISKASLAGAGSWAAVPAVAVSPPRLNMKDRYKIRISSSYTTGTSALVTGNADYDDVVLQATVGGGGGGGAGTLTNARLHDLMSGALGTGGALGTSAILKGNRLLVKVRCPAKVGRACRVALQGLLKKRKPATSKRKAKIAKGKAKTIVLRVKSKARPKVAKRKRLLFRLDVRAGKAKTTVYKNLKLIRRH